MFDRFTHEFEKVFARLHPGVVNAAVTDPIINSMEAFNADAEPPVSFSLPASGLSIPGSLSVPSLERSSRHHQVHLSRGGLLRENRPRDDAKSALDRLINGGLIGDPSM
jgi:hypothetical protein